MKNQTVLDAKDEYVQQTMKYGRIDALFALILYVFMLFLFALMGKIFVQKGSALTETYIFYVTGIVTLLPIGFVFLLCSIRKQKLTTVGFSKTHAIKSLGMGISLFMIVIGLKGIPSIISGSTIQTDKVLIIMRIIYFLIFVAFMEELVIRGYIGTRLYGYFTNKRLSIIIVGIMFSLEHIPFQMMVNRMNLIEYISLNRRILILFIIFHLVFQWLYSKYNSIIAPTIFHFIWNFIQWFIIS